MSLPKCPSISLSTSRDLGPSARLMARPCWEKCQSVGAGIPPAHLAEPASPADPVEVSLAVRPAPHVHWQVEVHHYRHLLQESRVDVNVRVFSGWMVYIGIQCFGLVLIHSV